MDYRCEQTARQTANYSRTGIHLDEGRGELEELDREPREETKLDNEGKVGVRRWKEDNNHKIVEFEGVNREGEANDEGEIDIWKIAAAETE